MKASDDKRIIPNTNRRLQISATRRKLFDAGRQERFLARLAATCNVTACAAAADICIGSVYRERRRNPAFRAAWDAALEQGYARLEAALLERALAGADAPRLPPADDVPAEPDWDKAMDLLRQHQRGLAGLPHRGGHVPRRVPIEQVAEKLIRKLKAAGVRLDEGAPDQIA